MLFSIKQYGHFLCQLLDEWTKDDNPEIFVRILTSTISMLMGGPSYLLDYGPNATQLIAFTVASNGDLSPDDTLRSSDPRFMQLGMNVRNTHLKDFLNHPTLQFIGKSARMLPQDCQNCCWQNMCQGGMIIHRYSSDNLFSNSSVMCEGLKIFYKEVALYLLRNGYSLESIIKNIC